MRSMIMTTYIFTDGNCKNNGNVNAIAAFSVYFEDFHQFNIVKKIDGPYPTNNKAELSAIHYALITVYENIDLFKDKLVIIVSDSMYSINCIIKWSDAWIKNGWKNSKGKAVLNAPLIKGILDISTKMRLEYNFQIFSYKHVNSHQQEPVDKNSKEYKLWYGNDKVDNLINDFLK